MRSEHVVPLTDKSIVPNGNMYVQNQSSQVNVVLTPAN